jgi:predicted chitinase
MNYLVESIFSDDIELKSNTIIIGDYIAYNLYQNLSSLAKNIKNLSSDKNLTTKELISILKVENVDESIKNVILSIGSFDFFSGINFINNLCDLLFELYPNAEFYVVEGFLEPEFQDDFEPKELKDLDDSRYQYYREFYKNNFTILESDELFSNEVIEKGSTKILNIINQIDSFIDLSPIIVKKNSTITSFESTPKVVSDDETDFDTIYEFLENFEKIYKSNNVYSINNTNKKYNADVHQIEIALKFLLVNSIPIFTVDGVFDKETERAVKIFQISNGLEDTGVVDPDTLEEIYYKLKIHGFDEDDLSGFLKQTKNVLDVVDKEKPLLNGKVKVNGYGGNELESINLMIDYMNEKGITNPYNQIGILCVIGKECNYIAKSEQCHENSSDDYLKKLFGYCRTNDIKIKKDWSNKYGADVTIGKLKKHCVDFFDAMYGKNATKCLGWETGNSETGDGYKYRGRGFNQITFKNTYKKYGDMLGEDLVNDPDRLNDPIVAAKGAVAFFTKGKSGDQLPQFENINDAVGYFVDVNAGGDADDTNTSRANDYIKHFEVIP